MDCRASLRMKRTLWRLLPCTAFCHLCIFRFPFTQRRIPSMYSFISCVPAESFKLCIMFTFFLLSWISSLFPFCLLRCLLWLLIWISVSRYMNYCLYLKTLKCDFEFFPPAFAAWLRGNHYLFSHDLYCWYFSSPAFLDSSFRYSELLDFMLPHALEWISSDMINPLSIMVFV